MKEKEKGTLTEMVNMVKRNSESFDIPAAENPNDVELMSASDNNNKTNENPQKD